LGEGFGLPITESLTCGKTVICNDLDVFTEVTNGLSLTFPTSDPASVLQIMESVLARGPESLEEANALKKQASNYSIENLSAQWASFFQDLNTRLFISVTKLLVLLYESTYGFTKSISLGFP
jgi:glycosyltransferase involved in cell wall biosynthesis